GLDRPAHFVYTVKAVYWECPLFPRSFFRAKAYDILISIKGVVPHEAYFPAQNASESQGARLPRPHEDQGRPPRAQGPPSARPQDAQRLSAVTAQEKPAPSQSLRFPRRFRLGRSRNYRYVYRKGKSFASRSLVLV